MSYILPKISRVGGLTLTVAIMQQLQRRYKLSLCNQNDAIPPPKIAHDNTKIIDKQVIEASANGDDEVWEQKRTTCGFCRSFLESPCAFHFKHWSKCVDLAKELELDYVEECAEYTTKLFKCTDEFKDYFESLSAHESSAVAEESSDDDTTKSIE